MKRLVGGEFLLDMSPIELEESVDGTTKTNITDNEVLGQLTDLKRFIGSPSMVKPIWCKLINGETDELIVARGTLAVVDVGEFEICIPLDRYKLKISVEFTQMETEDHAPLDDWYIDTNDAKYILISDAQSVASQFPDIDEFPIFEKITDAEGHKRFIDGDIDIETIAGVTKDYGKWSLSGTHLMIVLCLSLANTTEIADNALIASVELPSWVMDKIVPLIGSENGTVEYSYYIKAFSSSYTNQDFASRLDKYSHVLRINKEGALTLTDDRKVRIQFDLLIDNETPAP